MKENVKDLVLAIVTPLITKPEAIKLEVTELEDFIEYNLSVDQEDIGRVIGKQGRVIKAIRTLAYSVRTSNPKKIRINIID
ncbi:MAG: KH domain-containing protein [Streptococcaceae bacterium]|jgi:predicted RNA-binding protein YlqC (UPF0109 family)|nr:KH domain-containing protein [Streptococcaceae bacterium]